MTYPRSHPGSHPGSHQGSHPGSDSGSHPGPIAPIGIAHHPTEFHLNPTQCTPHFRSVHSQHPQARAAFETPHDSNTTPTTLPHDSNNTPTRLQHNSNSNPADARQRQITQHQRRSRRVLFEHLVEGVRCPHLRVRLGWGTRCCYWGGNQRIVKWATSDSSSGRSISSSGYSISSSGHPTIRQVGAAFRQVGTR